jgi:cytochrome c biogenesis protein CcmG, thiol:disulfide interchange protein DsbE
MIISMRGRARSIAVAATVALAAVAIGCGSDEEGPGNPESRAVDYEQALADAPAPLADLYAEGNELLSGGLDAFEARLEELRGHPVVVNKWASWCGPCRAEFPFFQAQAAKLGEEIAFLGVDGQDSDDAARTFLDELPLPYPSYSDPDLEISKELDAEIEFPSTIFFDSDGEQVYVHRGGYQDESDLVADIEKYAR